ncbi:MAG: hypothetical protein AABX23_04365 [Nanoarchaeota archaeon]
MTLEEELTTEEIILKMKYLIAYLEKKKIDKHSNEKEFSTSFIP